MKYPLTLLSAGLLTTGLIHAQPAPYLGQTPPGTTPEVFAPGLISLNNQYEFGSVFNHDLTEFFYGVSDQGKSETRYMRWANGQWTDPETILIADDWGYNDPFLSRDEQRLYVISEQPLSGRGAAKDYDIWYVERQHNGWSEPINPGAPINSSGNEYYISFTADGAMYFSSNRGGESFDIYKAPFKDGAFTEAMRLGPAINTQYYEADVFVDPEERYLIFAGSRPDGLGQGDLYISFRKADGSWTPSKNMGEVINSPGHELCPYVSPDGEYLFYTSRADIYWVHTDILETLR